MAFRSLVFNEKFSKRNKYLSTSFAERRINYCCHTQKPFDILISQYYLSDFCYSMRINLNWYYNRMTSELICLKKNLLQNNNINIQFYEALYR